MKKLLYLLLLTPIIYLASCSKSGVTPEVDNLYGCTDTLAFNFDSLATVNDSSCCYIGGCTVTTALNYDSNACSDDGSCIVIGDTYEGGIIFYLDGDGGGLIAAPKDEILTLAEWGCYGTAISGANGTGIGTGNQNTIDILAGCSQSGTAADICANYTDGTYSDWFLPSKDELYQMYLNIGKGNALGLGNIGGFDNSEDSSQSTNLYWSSNESDKYYSYTLNFDTGNNSRRRKEDYSFNVRAIRAF